MVDKSEFAIATSQLQNLIPFLIELLFNLLSQIITISTIKLTSKPVKFFAHQYPSVEFFPRSPWRKIVISPYLSPLREHSYQSVVK